MDITDVNVKLVEGGEERLKASCTVIIDGEFVIRDVKVIEGTNGLFVAMPSRKLTDHCPRCRHKNHLRARYCNHCGQQLNENRATQGRARSIQLHAEVAHPINSGCRSRLQNGVLEAYEDALKNSRSGDRRPSRRREVEFADAHEDDVDTESEPMGGYNDLISELKSEAKSRRGDSEDFDDNGDERDIDGDRFDLEDDDDEVDEVKHESRHVESDSQAAAAPVPPPAAPVSRPAPPPAPKPTPAPSPAPSASRVEDDDFGAGIL